MVRLSDVSDQNFVKYIVRKMKRGFRPKADPDR
jgi:hypothetical protein